MLYLSLDTPPRALFFIQTCGGALTNTYLYIYICPDLPEITDPGNYNDYAITYHNLSHYVNPEVAEAITWYKH